MAGRKQKRERMTARVVEDEEYQLSYERVAGIDVAKASGVVCVRLPPEPGKTRRTSRTWQVTAVVPEIEAVAAELRAAGVQLVSMGSASDYRRVWFVVLEAAGLAVQLVNSARAKNLPGRPETDELDARWIARLTGMGLLAGSFVPPPQIRALRQRHRRIRQRPGGGGWKKANCAVGRSILVIVWHLLAGPAARYTDLGRTTTPGTPAPAARSVAANASSKPSATTSCSSRARPPEHHHLPLTA